MGDNTRLKRVNNVLLVFIILINGYVIVGPFLPALFYDWNVHTGEKAKLQNDITAGIKTKTVVQTNQPDHVIIPSMLLDTQIYNGPVSQQYSLLDKGIWRYANGSTPDKGGNTVLVGHRFTYTKPKGIFYYLNKLAVGDPLAVWWNNREYVYKVSKVEVVPPNDTAVEASSSTPELTLFTCTPLLLPKDRLVVVASLEAKS
jgi:LPXTG-site transpeptidase (sortase) family protein